jgi:hypothetical protein
MAASFFKLLVNIMRRTCSINTTHSFNDIGLIRQAAFHEAGHAAAIHIGNRQKQLPPIFFQIFINQLHPTNYPDGFLSAANEFNSAYLTKIEGGRLIHTLPSFVDKAAYDFTESQKQAYLEAFEADIFNYLVGPIAEATYVALRDNETINPHLVDLNALNFYGGRSDLEAINDYLDCLNLSTAQREEKLSRLFFAAFSFINDAENWHAILTLAEYILSSNKTIIDHEDIITVLDNNKYFLARTNSWF